MTTTQELRFLARNPVAFDTALAALHSQREAVEARIVKLEDQAHREAGDKRVWQGRSQVWQMSTAHALANASEATNALHTEGCAHLRNLNTDIIHMGQVYMEAPWSRFFPTETSSGGHIHSATGCSTLYASTKIFWRPDLSGKTNEEAVADLGPALCQVCFPEAKAEHKRQTLGQVAKDRSRAERQLLKDQRDAAKAIKTLTPGEQFRTVYGHDTVTTVAACKTLIREAAEASVDVEYTMTDACAALWAEHGPERLAQYRANVAQRAAQVAQDAGNATTILMLREQGKPGTGADAEAIAKMWRTAAAKARKGYGL